MSGQSVETKPRPASDVMLRRTWTYRWDQEEVPKLLDRLAELFLMTSQEAHWSYIPHISRTISGQFWWA